MSGSADTPGAKRGDAAPTWADSRAARGAEGGAAGSSSDPILAGTAPGAAPRSAPVVPAYPAATYRLQLRPGFGFDAARGLLDHLQRLGVEWIYLSPVFEARQGSEHGYDVVDPRRPRAELGGEPAWQRLLAALRRRGLGLLLDIVPNHMAAAAANPWWWDTLKHGRGSPSARFFDIDWDAGGGKVALPILGRSPRDAIARGELRLDWGSPHDDEEPVVRYWNRTFPVAPGSPEAPMEALLEAQHYRLFEWRDGTRRINYRRFFDIGGLVGTRVEDPEVLDATHAMIRRLVESGAVAGLRVDHVDGLRDPAGYLRRLRELSVEPGVGENGDSRRNETSLDARERRPIVLVEKILASGEELPDWPVEGTTGYEVTNAITRLFVDAEGAARLRADAARRTGVPEDFAQTRRRAKREVMESLFPAELDRLTALLGTLHRALGGAVSDEVLRRAIVELTASLDVYRTYGFRPGDDGQRARLERALAGAREALTSDDTEDASDAVATLEAALLADLDEKPAELARNFVARWQQSSGAVMAKGLEDTALYRDVALPALCEVGGEPDVPLDAVAAFHALGAARAERFPLALNATATHDTKRGEDTRLRLAVLTELAPAWTAALDRWSEWHQALRRTVRGRPAPGAADEILCYQTLLALWPVAGEPGQGLAERLRRYLRKAAREAKVHTSWTRPDEEYENALSAFATELALGARGARFREDSASLRATIARHGAINSLSQLVLKTMAPGVPDFYQGTELWHLALVDPDNRRVPDFDRRRRILGDVISTPLDALRLAELRRGWRRGTIKLALTMRLLALRRAARDLFARGEYVPLAAEGAAARHLCVFARRLGAAVVLVLVPRLTVALAGEEGWPLGDAVWGDTSVPWTGAHGATEWLTGRGVAITGGRLRVGQVLDVLPVAVVVGGTAS